MIDYETNSLHQAPIVQLFRRINFNPADNAIGFYNTYPLDSELSGG